MTSTREEAETKRRFEELQFVKGLKELEKEEESVEEGEEAKPKLRREMAKLKVELLWIVFATRTETMGCFNMVENEMTKLKEERKRKSEGKSGCELCSE